MRKELIWSLPGLYREDMEVYGYHFGRGDKAACVVGALRGNEVQQMYVCSSSISTSGMSMQNTTATNFGKNIWSSTADTI